MSTLTPPPDLHKAWAHLDAPDIAKGYWHLSDDAKWVDTLKCMYADESNHRDVNHTFASMEADGAFFFFFFFCFYFCICSCIWLFLSLFFAPFPLLFSADRYLLAGFWFLFTFCCLPFYGGP